MALILLATNPAHGIEKLYQLSGDSSLRLPTDGTILRPGTVRGIASIEDDGNGTPTLANLEVRTEYTDIVTIGTVFGVFVAEIEWRSLAAPTPGQVGLGSTTTDIAWGTLTGWTQTGFLDCRSILCGPGPCTGGESACTPLVGAGDGIGPLPPLAGSEFDLGPWSFSPDMTSFTLADSTEFIDLNEGVVTGGAIFSGMQVQIPALRAVGLGALGIAIALLGVAARRRV